MRRERRGSLSVSLKRARVLILVLVEYAPREISAATIAALRIVLILVLVEYAPRVCIGLTDRSLLLLS